MYFHTSWKMKLSFMIKLNILAIILSILKPANGKTYDFYYNLISAGYCSNWKYL